MEQEPAHLAFGGSNAHRWMQCAGSVSLCATLPQQPDSVHSARGTAAHKLLEQILRRRGDDALDFVDTPTDEPLWSKYDQEDVEAVQKAVDYVNGILAANPDAILHVEHRVKLFDDTGGTADVLIFVPSKRHLHVIDYKHGAGIYVTEEAPQFRFYGTCAVMTLTDLDVGTVYATVIQPRHHRSADNPVRTAVYGVADMINYSDDVEAAREAAKAPEPEFRAGEWCDWCPAAHVCPAHRDEAFGIVTLPAGGDRAPVGEEIKIILPPPGTCRDPAVLAQTLPALAAMKNWISAIEDAAYGEAMAGKHLPGYKLINKIGRRAWIDEENAAAWLEFGVLLDDDQIYVRKVKSVAQAEKLAKAALKDMPKDIRSKRMTAFAALAEQKSSGLKLVEETEPGEPVNPLELLAAIALPPPVID